ncbi:DUF2460 domain-containing protein [Oceanicella sp. SM1341]|uniref:DUF2460 domain-containing protein n=1 Tax=Oceanicella sp. SM1341 TaxID=1548889 RepID=UPI000E492129|nr:DUF2460 domain-containing protein [Oceanicella sp. SM1341]
MSFHETRFPAGLSFGSTGGPERRVEIVTLANGFEERNAPWAQSRRSFDAGIGLRSLDDLEEIVAFFEARGGQLNGFRWKDWTDYKSCKPSGTPARTDQPLGTGDGSRTTFQLVKRYASGGSVYLRDIRKPVQGTVLVGVNGAAAAGVSVDTTTGVVSFASPPANGAAVTAGFEFDVPVRFSAERIDTSLAAFQAGEMPSIPVIEVRV